jgi:hypothetical protein
MANRDESKMILFLGLSILIDLIGVLTYIFPGVGETFDLAWAPISAAILHTMYGNWLLTITNLVEEIAPGLDIIPTALIAWYFTFGRRTNNDRHH